MVELASGVTCFKWAVGCYADAICLAGLTAFEPRKTAIPVGHRVDFVQ